MKKALSSTDILTKKYNLIKWDGSWYDNFKHPESRGVWFISGNSGNGKTAFMLQLAKALSKYGRVLYNSLEEGNSLTMQEAWKQQNVAECGRRIQLINESISELEIRLDKRQSPDIIIIDSWQYTDLNWERYLLLKRKYHNKLFIFNSQMDGSKPMGKTALRVQYDADLKIWVEGFKAFSKGRYLGPEWEKGYIIWKEGAIKYWGQSTNN
ncbi:hypothetical protein ACFOWU_10125 [Epilithonimonas zeae]|uniref:AAA+ ATPase domain-containing protein n=1 Tax=Epilithonimonas zeae TaxID=1416779 RepID=A0A1N6GX03_9FLAO|nr:hypothetical protein [Epilithonimonas zeae]SIO12068.1 hypothetical protein SAMN05444409_2110 [Epilithonimonas zeae]